MSQLTDSPAWQALLAHQREMSDVTMRDLFAAGPGRFERFSLQVGDILFDYSKNRITEKTMSLLFDRSLFLPICLFIASSASSKREIVVKSCSKGLEVG